MDNKIIEIKLNRLEEDQKAITERLENAHDKINDIGRDLVRIETAVQPRDLPWAIRFVLLPLAVATTIATVGAVIHLEIVVAGMGRDVTKQSLISHASLSPDDFKATLPDFAATMSKAEHQRINLSPTVISDLQTKLVATDTSTPAFWPAAAAFISYRSEILSPFGRERLKLRDCTTLPWLVHTTEPISGTGKQTVGITPATYRDCQIILDSEAAIEKLSHDLSISNVIFERCVVVYRGGVIVLTPQRVATETPPRLVGNLSFKDCLFVLSFTSAPPPPGQQLTRTLLMADTNTVNLGPSS